MLTEFIGYPYTWEVYDQYLKSLEKCDTFITGMSYIRNALMPWYLKGNVCSSANSSQDLYYDLLFFQEALQCNPKIKTVIIGLAPYSLRYDLSLTKTPVEQTRLYYYCARFGDYHNNRSITAELCSYMKLLAELKDLFGNAFEIELYREYLNHQENMLHTSNRVFHPAQMIEEERLQMKGKYHKPYEATLSENQQILQNYLTLAQKHNIKVIIFIPPYSNWYKQHWDPAYRSELFHFLSKLHESYSFTYLDFSEIELSDEYFEDYAHLNRLGAIYVASEVNRYL